MVRKKDGAMKQTEAHSIHLEPKYWPEIRDYIDTLRDIIERNTISDQNIQQVNERIVEYVLEQINRKGLIADPTQRYLALETLVDRVLLVDLSKIAGLKQNEGTQAQFSQATAELKKHLMNRQREENQAAGPSS